MRILEIGVVKMAVNAVGSADAVYQRDSSKDSRNLSIDTSTFLKLLVTQLKYQDPLEPQKDTAFVTQMAQMTTLQEMQEMNATLKNSQAYDMVGKEIYAEVQDKESSIKNVYTGLVESVVIKDGIPYVVVGGKAISVSDVLQVFPTPETDTTTTDTTTTKTV